MELSKDDKLKELGITGVDLPEEAIIFLYKNKYRWMKKEEQDEEEKKNNIDKTTEKYKITLKFVNLILKNIGKEAINDLTNFKDIDREDIIKDENKAIITVMKNELFMHFDKMKNGWYRKVKSTRLVLSCMDVMCDDLGLELSYRKKNTQKNSIFKTHYLYSIN